MNRKEAADKLRKYRSRFCSVPEKRNERARLALSLSVPRSCGVCGQRIGDNEVSQPSAMWGRLCEICMEQA